MVSHAMLMDFIHLFWSYVGFISLFYHFNGVSVICQFHFLLLTYADVMLFYFSYLISLMAYQPTNENYHEI